MSNQISVADEELMAYIIDGIIPGEILRNQTRPHNFDSKSSLLKAFEKDVH